MLKFNLLSIVMLCSLFTYQANAQHPSVGGYNVYYGHLHNHTSYSDGEGTPAEAYVHARDVAGLDFFGLSEHGTHMIDKNWESLKNIANTYNKDGSFVTFWGFEWSSSSLYGHVSVINTADYTNVFRNFTFSNLLDWLEGREGIAFFNHAGREDIGSEFQHFEGRISDHFVGMELWNKTKGFEKFYYTDGYFSNDGNKSFYDEALIRGWKIGASGSHDHHSKSWGDVDMAMGVLSHDLTKDALYAAIKSRRFFSTEDRSLALSLQVNGSEMGSTIIGGSLDLHVEAYDKQNERFSKVELYKNGVLSRTWTADGTQVNIDHTVTGMDKDYFYVKVTQADGDEAISSPVFISGNGNLPPAVTLTSPTNNGTYTVGSTIVLSADASDAEGSVKKVVFYQNGQKIGEDTQSPYRIEWNGAGAGQYTITAQATDDAGLTGTSPAVKITVRDDVSLTVSSRIAASEDDAEEGRFKVVVNNSSDLELVYDGILTGNQQIGLRFQSLGIPQGAIIKSASLQFTCDETSSEATNVSIYGEATDDAATFTVQNTKISERSLTQAYVNWAIPAWNSSGEAGQNQRSPELRSVIQEIVDRPGWRGDKRLALIIKGSGKRVAKAYDGSATQAAKLTVTYTTANGSNRISSTLETDKSGIEDFQVYPIPFINEVNVKVNDGGDYDFLLHNLMGKAMTVKVEKNDTGYVLDTSLLPKGIYTLVITKEGASSRTVKLVKE